uniref:Large ribosomal subunit protein mL45 n=1 Tax=Strongyloides papillosus TaxID=174720 RepID=A0A0N5BMR1_STREA
MSRLGSSISRSILCLKPLSITQFCGVHHHMERGDLELFLGIKRSNKARANRNTHKNERMFRRLRGQKTMIMNLPDDVKVREQNNLPPSELRRQFLKDGINPYKDVSLREWEDHQMTIQSFYQVIDPYVRPKFPGPFLDVFKFGKSSKERFTPYTELARSVYLNITNGTRAIRKYEDFKNFNAKEWASKDALEIYEMAYKSLTTRDEKEICKYVTEHAFQKLWPDVEKGGIYFEFLGETAPPKVVSVRCADNPAKSGNSIAQITLKLCTKQKIAVFDRFGHLILGSKDKVKEVEEYVVFENHIASRYGRWRLHDKIEPPFANNDREVSALTGPEKPKKNSPKPSKSSVVENKKLAEVNGD